MKTLKTTKALIAALSLMTLAACGKAPELPTSVAKQTQVEITDSEVVDTYDKDHIPEACAALRAWEPAAKTIKVSNGTIGMAGTSTFSFGAAKITQTSVSGGTVVISYSTTLNFRTPGASVDTCTPQITTGKLTAVN